MPCLNDLYHRSSIECSLMAVIGVGEVESPNEGDENLSESQDLVGRGFGRGGRLDILLL